MKNKINFIIALTVLVASSTCILISKQNEPSIYEDLKLMNIEALANGEGGGDLCRWRTEFDDWNGWTAICDKDGVGYNCECGDKKDYGHL